MRRWGMGAGALTQRPPVVVAELLRDRQSIGIGGTGSASGRFYGMPQLWGNEADERAPISAVRQAGPPWAGWPSRRWIPRPGPATRPERSWGRPTGCVERR